MNNLQPELLYEVARALARQSPATVYRLSLVNKKTKQAVAPTIRSLNALKRLIRRRVAIMRHFNQYGRLGNALYREKAKAVARSHMTPNQKRRSQQRNRAIAASVAYARYQNSGTEVAWNRFVRAHIAAGRNRTITRAIARNTYGRNV